MKHFAQCWLCGFLFLWALAAVMSLEPLGRAQQPPAKQGPVPVALLEMMELGVFEEWIAKEYQIDEDVILSAGDRATELARQKQIAGIVGEGKTVELTLAAPVVLPALDAKDVEECVALFVKTLGRPCRVTRGGFSKSGSASICSRLTRPASSSRS